MGYLIFKARDLSIWGLATRAFKMYLLIQQILEFQTDNPILAKHFRDAIGVMPTNLQSLVLSQPQQHFHR